MLRCPAAGGFDLAGAGAGGSGAAVGEVCATGAVSAAV